MKYPFFIFILCFSTLGYCQENKSNSIISFSDKLLLKINPNKRSESFLIESPENKAFVIEANNIYKIKLSANYKFLALNVGIYPGNGRKGKKSKFRNIQLQLFLKQWVQTLEYRKLSGFFQEEISTENITNQYPNLKTINWTGNTAYILNPYFSLKHILSQNEWQIKSAGSFIPSLDYGFNRISDILENGKYIQNNFDITLSPSYHYTWVIQKQWFLASSLSPSLGIRFSKENNAKSENIFLTKHIKFKLQFGYTNNNLSLGANFNFESSTARGNLFLNSVNDKSYAGIYFGYRINPPKQLEKTTRWLENKLGI